MAIIERFTRPAIPIDCSLMFNDLAWPDDFAAPPVERIRRAASAIGRLRVTGDRRVTLAGTAFLVAPRLAFAASHSVKLVTAGAGRDVRYRDHRRLVVDFIPGGSIDVEGIAFLHPFFRIALLQLAAGSTEPDPLICAATTPEDLRGKEVVLISCAAHDTRNDAADIARIWGDGLDTKFFVQPGRVLQIGELSFGTDAPGLLHDCSSLGGSTGAPLIDLSNGDVLGVHTSGIPGTFNYAEVLWECARDPVVWEYPVRFRPDPRPSWLAAWGSPSVPRTPVGPPPTPKGSWSVNAPLSFAHPEVKDLLQTLYEGISDPETAMNIALDAGVTRGTVDDRGSAQQVWRRILERASAKGVLPTLIRSIAEDQEYAGLKTRLEHVL